MQRQSRMRFIFLTLGYHPDLVGGAYRYVTELAERLVRRGHQVEVICPRAKPELPAFETRAGVELHRFPNPAGFFYWNWRQENASASALLRRLRRRTGEKTIVILCHAFLAPAARRERGNTLFLFTGPWAEEFLFARRALTRSRWQCWRDNVIASMMRRTEREALQNVRGVLTISRYYEKQLPLWHGPQLAPVTMISGGVNLDQFRPLQERLEIRARFGLASEQFLFLTLRRLDPRMGLMTLIEAFAAVQPEFPQARLWLAGQGSYREALERKIQEGNLEGKAKLVGFIPELDLPSYLNAADCMVMPSLDLEGLGLATLESLACGTPVLGSRAGATPELLSPLDPELLFDPDSASDLARKLRWVLSKPDVLPTSVRCRQHVQNHFTWDRTVSALEHACREGAAH
jgi:glycosyltransferase involved in cell wall biosynthesis